jgi:hypothetical protein
MLAYRITGKSSGYNLGTYLNTISLVSGLVLSNLAIVILIDNEISSHRFRIDIQCLVCGFSKGQGYGTAFTGSGVRV